MRRLHEVVSGSVDDLTAAMVEEYGGVVQFAAPIVQASANAFLAAEKALQELTRNWGKTTVTSEPVGSVLREHFAGIVGTNPLTYRRSFGSARQR